MAIVWLASYPKSGNTWLRALLTAYLTPSPDTPELDALVGAPIASIRHQFDERIGLTSADMTAGEIDLYRPAFVRALAAEAAETLFVKTHDGFRANRAGEAIFPSDATRAAIYLVRNPLDVAVSFAHHESRPVVDVIERMARDDFGLGMRPERIEPLLPQRLGSWSGHVASWLDQDQVRVQVLRYEDMIADPATAFRDVLRLSGLSDAPAAVRNAVDRARFERLQARERISGFAERQPTAASFFRSGRVGDWRRVLSPAEHEAIVDRHGAVMERLGYLTHESP